MVASPLQRWRVVRKLVRQSWVPALVALLYAAWDFSSIQPSQRTVAAFVKTLGGAFFVIMWFVGQWFRTSKELTDSEQLGSLRQGLDRSLTMLQELTDAATAETQFAVQPDGEVMRFATQPSTVAVERVLAEIPKSPKGALLVLGAEVERELRELLWSSGWIQGVGAFTVAAADLPGFFETIFPRKRPVGVVDCAA